MVRPRLLILVTATLAVSALAVTAPLDVPFVRQIRAGCGSAAIAMVMQYWVRQDSALDRAAADAERIDQALPPGDDGLSGEALRKYIEAHGFKAYVFNGEVHDLREHLAKGRPLVVCLGARGPREPLHFVVVVGIEDDAIILNDPARGKLIREKSNRFERAWAATGNWSMLAVPRPHS